MTYLPIAHFKTNEVYSQVFYVQFIKDKLTGAGKKYSRVIFSDTSGSIEGNIWDRTVQKIEPNTFISLKIKTKIYKDKLEFSADERDLTVTPTVINTADYFIALSQNEITAYIDNLKKSIDQIEDQDYRDILMSDLQNNNWLNVFAKKPYLLDGPLDFEGGLLRHTSNLMNASLSLATLYDGPYISKSLVILGSLYKNIGLTQAVIQNGPNFIYNDLANLSSLEQISSNILDASIRSASAIFTLPEAKIIALKSIHGKNGTLESQIIDQTNSLLNSIDNKIYSNQTTGTNWRGKPSDGHFIGHIKG